MSLLFVFPSMFRVSYISEAFEHHVTVVSCDSCEKHDEIACVPAAPATHGDEKENK